MIKLLSNLFLGVSDKIKKSLHRPFSVFNISFFKEKIWKHQTSLSPKFHIYKGKYKIEFKDSQVFLLSIKELFINEFYKFRTSKLNPRIIDCGSYIGTSILYFKDNYPFSNIIAFEPDSSNFSLLTSNLSSWKFEDVQIFNAAVWIENGSISFNSEGNMSSRIIVNGNSASSNLIKCVRLSDFLNEEVDFLKIDIEGAEYEVLKDCSEKLHFVKNLFIEYHGDFQTVNRLNEILDILYKCGFKYYIKEGSEVYNNPFWEIKKDKMYDQLLNIFAFKDL